jgi:hypothetical protein
MKFSKELNSLIKEYSLTQHDKKRLQAELELTKVKLDFSIQKLKENDKLTIYLALRKYAGFNRFDREESEFRFEDLMNNVVFMDKSEFSDIFLKSLSYDLFLLSDRVNDILERTNYNDCFYYTLWKKEGATLHFRNAIVPNHPLKRAELEKRKQELISIAQDLKYNHPYLEYVYSVSWMWNLKSFQDLVPKKFVYNMKKYTDISAYRLGHWGQFYLFDGTLNHTRLELFKKRYEFPLKCMLVECSLDEFINYYIKNKK